MVYKNQNYMTNPVLKEQADKVQKDYVDPEQEEVIVTRTLQVAYIDSEETYNTQLADEDSVLNRYYAKYPREDGVDEDGHPVRDPTTEVVGHTWESAITAPTDPAQTSSFPWILLDLVELNGTIDFKYDEETVLTKNVTNRSFMILSVPNNLGLTECRLEWGTGEKPEHPFDISKLEVVYTEAQE